MNLIAAFNPDTDIPIILAIIGAIPLTLTAWGIAKANKNLGSKNGRGDIATMNGQQLRNQEQTMRNQQQIATQLMDLTLMFTKHVDHHEQPTLTIMNSGPAAALLDPPAIETESHLLNAKGE